MRAFILLSLFLIGLLSSLVVTAEKAYGARARVINDSLVSDLSCSKLTIDSIYQAIRPDAFSERRNIPIYNWGFYHGNMRLGVCWGLASTQRMISYMARYNVIDAQPVSARVPIVLNMIRGAEIKYSIQPDRSLSGELYDNRLKNYSTFAVEGNSLLDTDSLDGLWGQLITGYEQNVSGILLRRNFISDIQANQVYHFFRFRNVPMVIGGEERSEKANRKTFIKLKQNLDGKRLTLLNLRISRFTQHVVMLKSYKKISNSLYAFNAYDSNSPLMDRTVYYDNNMGKFFAPDIVRNFVNEDRDREIGAFIVDEGERKYLEKALLTHYQKLCR